MAQITERATAIAPRQLRDQIGSFRRRSDELAIEARLFQIAAKESLRFQLVARRVDRVELDQPP